MEQHLRKIAKLFWPRIEEISGSEYISALFNVTGFLYSTPFVIAGLGWLVAVTDLALLRTQWLLLCLLLALLFLFEQLDFFFFVEITPGIYSDWQSSLSSIIVWSAAFIFGPTGLWLAVIYACFHYTRRWFKYPAADKRWNCARNFNLNMVEVLTSLIALHLYTIWISKNTPGRAFPLPDLTLQSIWPAFLATFFWWALPTLLWTILLVYFERQRIVSIAQGSRKAYLKFWAGALGWPILAGPFAVLAAGLYAQNGLGGYLYFISSLLLASWLAHHLSQSAQRSQQRSRELEKLELLSRAILESPPDASTLPDLLNKHISNMFPLNSIIIHVEQVPLFPAKTIFHHIAQGALVSQESLPASDAAWEWLRMTTTPHTFLPGETLPWKAALPNDGIIVVPILDVEHSKTIGGIMLAQSWQPETITNLIPALQSLAGQIASALHRASIFRIEQEMAVAGKIQASFLPDKIPDIPGWHISATLKPARETSGDFYDFIPLKEGKLGLLIADVADKGTGAALYMAVCRTLIRTFAAQYDTQPELALKAANQRIMAETRADLFVSIFYGILDPAAQTLTYCNAGHNPPYVVHPQHGSEAQKLTRTGMVIGVMEDSEWEQSAIKFSSGDALVMFTDGITDAENGQGEFFGEPRLLKTVLDHRKHSSQEMQNALMEEIYKFVGEAPQFDDITLMIVKKD